MNAITRQTTEARAGALRRVKMIDVSRQIDNCAYTSVTGRRDDIIAVSLKIWCVEMTVAIDPHVGRTSADQRWRHTGEGRYPEGGYTMSS